jgi:hypothetical protein
MKKDFSFYEFTGVIVPGSTLLLGMAANSDPLRQFLANEKFGAAHLGLFVVASYIIGHLVQGIGNVLENCWWVGRGMPTNWIRREKVPFLNDGQIKRLREVLTALLGHDPGDLKKLDIRATRNITGQLYAKLEKEGRVARIEIFNGNYGLFRGIAASLLVVTGTTIAKHGFWTHTTLITSAILVVALLRMNRFGVHYASELYRQALNLVEQPKPVITP